MTRPAADPIRVLLYSHDSQGLGHIRRNMALAHALAQRLPSLTGRQVTGMLLTGVGHAATLDLPDGFDIVVLPGIRKGSSGYTPRHVQVPMADLIDVRGRMLNAVVRGFEPDLVIIDRHAYGVDGELQVALTKLRRRSPNTKIVLGLREVLDDPESVAREWTRLGDLQQLRELFDELWVYGDPTVHDLSTSGELPISLRDRAHYTGYLASGRRWLPGDDPVDVPFLLTMVGGGSDGMELCRTAAQAPVPAGYRHLIVTGPQMPEQQRREIELLAGANTRVVASVPDGLTTIRRASALVSMAGYNTVCEVMSTPTPVLLVPRETPRLEQTIRARALARVGAVDIARQAELTPEVLGSWMRGAVRRTQSRDTVNLKGLTQVARRAAELVGTTTPAKELLSSAAG